MQAMAAAAAAAEHDEQQTPPQPADECMSLPQLGEAVGAAAWQRIITGDRSPSRPVHRPSRAVLLTACDLKVSRPRIRQSVLPHGSSYPRWGGPPAPTDLKVSRGEAKRRKSCCLLH